MIRLSIIVPIYNVEQYIEECIRSMYHQDIPLTEYEVICVDDCSPDGSRAIVEHLQQEYTNLQLIINERNRKLGGARNAGLDAAKGKYIWFVDSDDYIAPNSLNHILNTLEENKLELIQFDSCEFDEHSEIKPTIQYEDQVVITGSDFVLDKEHGVWSERSPVAWNRVQSREFLLRHKLRFVENLMYEDTDYSLYMYPLVKRMKHINLIGYYHRMNPNSITRVKNTGQILYYRVMQQVRCTNAFKVAPNVEYKELLYMYIHSELTLLRQEIKYLPFKEKIVYYGMVHTQKLYALKGFCNWRTWMAIKYGLTLFIAGK